MDHATIVKTLTSFVHSKSSLINLSWVPIKKPISFQFYSEWLNQNKNAGMTYLRDQAAHRANPIKWAGFAKSVLILQFPYLPHPWPKKVTQNLNIAKYAQGYDYHDKMIADLNHIIDQLKPLFPQATFKPVTDSTPLLERDQAYQAGLGWFGKNTCLIHPKTGSFFLLGEILSSVEIMEPIETNTMPDLCGKCQLCVTSCPTGALSEGPTLDANLCLSYWNIESQEIPSDNLKNMMQDLFFGCDICQDVCPWNIKPMKKAFSPNPQSPESNDPKIKTIFNSIEAELLFYLSESNRSILRHIQDTPLTRARPFGLRRNAIIVATNLKINHLKNSILTCIERYPKLDKLKPWVLSKLT